MGTVAGGLSCMSKRNQYAKQGAALGALVLVLLLVLTGCLIKWRGQDLLSVDPDAQIWVHHPENSTNDVPPRP